MNVNFLTLLKNRTHRDLYYLNIAMPAAFEGVFMILLANIDIILVGHLGTEAIAAVSIFTQPRMVILTLARSVATTLSLVAAKALGSGNKPLAYDHLKTTLIIWGAVLVFLHIAFYLNLRDILFLMGAKGSYIDLALEYSNPALIAVLITSATTIFQAVLLGFGKTRAVFWANLLGNVVNLVASAFFIFGLFIFPKLGVFGAALGTIIGAVFSLFYTLIVLKRENMLSGKMLSFSDYYNDFIKTFASVFSEQGFERVGMVLYTRMVAELGELPYAVHAICMNFCDFYYSFAGGLGKANMVLAGQTKAKENEKLFTLYRSIGFNFSLLFSCIAFILTVLFREEIFMIYSVEPSAVALGTSILIIVALASFPEAHAMVSAGILRGSGHSKSVAIYSFVSVAVFRPIITWIFIYALNMGLIGAWCALLIDQSTRAVCAHYLLHKYR